MSENERHLTPKQQRAIEELLTQPTIRAAATAAGIGEATLRRWLSDPAFQAAYRDAQEQLLGSVVASLRSASVVAVSVLREVADNSEAPTSARVASARTILEMMLRSRELLEIERRLHALESAIGPTLERRFR